jgi:hypothetical protein
VAITSGASDESGKTFTIYGTTRDGIAQSETITGPGATLTVYTQSDFKTVTRIAVSAATTGAITAGTNAVGSTQWFQRDWVNFTALGILLYIPGTSNVSVEATFDDPNQPLDFPPYYATPVPQSTIPPIAVPFDSLTGISASLLTEVTVPCFMYRLTINSGTDPVTMKAIEITPWSRAGA